MEAYEIKIYGKVQKVGFRKFIWQKATQLGIRGFVENKDDGSVFVFAVGRKEDLNNFLKYCKEGSGRSLVDEIKVESVETDNPPSLKLRRTSYLSLRGYGEISSYKDFEIKR
jgi:acylphosphatase